MIRALLLAALLASPAGATSVSTFTLSGSTAPAGQSAPFTIARTAGTGGQSVTFRTADGSAKAGADYTAVTKTIQFGPYQKSATVQVPTIIDPAALGKTLGFGASITVKGAVVASASAAIVEPPAPTPAPLPPSGWVPSPGLHGLADIASNFDTAAELVTAQVPPSSAPDVVGAFRFLCMPGQVLRDDPIVYPGQPGASHLHQFYGNTGANASSTFQSLRAAGDSSCMTPLNRSGYWMPAMLDGKGNVVRPDYVTIYYKRRPATDPIVSDPSNPQYEGQAVPLPNGLRFIFGFNMLNPSDPATGTPYFNCDGPTATPGHYPNLTTAFANCPAGNRVGAIITAPSCWDGKNLDSPDHRSHVGYPGYGDWGYLKCPSGYPYVIPSFTMGAWFSIVPGDDTSKWSLSSDAMHPELPPGSTLHGDWFGAWDRPTMDIWMANCIDKMLNCSAGVLGNGQQMHQTFPFSWNANPRLVPVP